MTTRLVPVEVDLKQQIFDVCSSPNNGHSPKGRLRQLCAMCGHQRVRCVRSFTSSKSASCHVLLKSGSSGPFVNLGIPTAATCSNVPASLPRAFARLLSLPVSAGLICWIALVRRLNSANGRAATSAVLVRALAAQRVRLTTSRSQWNYLAAPVVVPGAVFVPVRRTSRRSCRPARRTSRRSCRPARRS